VTVPPSPVLRDVPLDRFFNPRTVAVVGASATHGSGQRLLYRTVKKKVEAQGGTVYPVNPNRDEIDGQKCYRSIHDIDAAIDLAVILVDDPVSVLRDAVAKHPTFVMIYAAGFAEAGPDGLRAQQELREIVRQSGVYLLGPNTTLNSFLPLREDLPGKRIALVSHSGHQGRHIWEGQEIGIPLAGWAPTGNEVDLEFSDFVKYFADRDDVGAIAGYVEGFKSGATLLAAAEYAAQRATPLVLVKVGRTRQGESTALSHTAHVAGSDLVATGVFRQHGIVRVDALDELLYVSTALARWPAPLADGVCVYTISGGTAANLTDLVAAAGLSVPELAAETQQALREWIPPRLRVSNPVDSGGPPSGDWRGRKILETLVSDPGVGVVVCPFVANAGRLSDAVVRDVADLIRTSPKPICLIWGSPLSDAPAYKDVLIGSGVVTFRTFSQCIRAISGYFEYHRYLARRGDIPADSDISPHTGGEWPAPEPLIPYPGPLSERAAKQVLASFGIEVSTDRLAKSSAEAVRFAADIGFPVVLKISSPDIPHKSAAGLVAVGVRSESETAQTFEEFVDRAKRIAGEARIEGVLVCETIPRGLEILVGVVRDEVFGPSVVVGLGGEAVEVMGDVSARVPPFGRAEAERMIGETYIPELLRRRTGPEFRASLDAIVNVVMAVQRLVLVLGDRLVEVDLNPVIVLPGRAVLVDALIATRGEPA
jgi:acetate---CoA ligase (ADP-forming)